MPSNNKLTKDDIYKLIDLYYTQPNILYSHQHNSFNQFVDEYIYSILKRSDNIFFSKITQNYVYNYKFMFDDIYLKPPTLENESELMFPSDARVRSLTYSSKLVATITQIQEKIDVVTKEKTHIVIGEKEQEYHITNLPIMLRSKYCSLNIKKNHDKKECNYDPGGYFIVNGSEKVVVSLERMVENKPLVFIKKDQSNKIYTVQVNSKDYETENTQIFSIRMKKDHILTMKIPQFNEIPIFILVKALGIESDKDIIDYIVNDSNDVDMINLVRLSLDNTVTENKTKILTQEEAIEYLITKMKSIKKYSDTSVEDRLIERRMHLMNILKKDILPHMGTNIVKKSYYICHMIHKLLKCFLGRKDVDDRDSYVNKRVDIPGVLIAMLFKQYFKKMLNECNKFFKKRNPDDENPINIIGQIKPNIIEQGLKSALLTGSWGGSKTKKGVAQVLDRLSFLQTMSYLRRVSSPTIDVSTNKLTSPRHLHNTQYGTICVTGNTEVLMSDGSLKLIKDMRNGDAVLTINPKTLEHEPSQIKNFFKIDPKTLYEITTISGRKIKSTGDHPFLVKCNDEYVWKKTKELRDSDLLIVKHSPKYIGADENEPPLVIKSTEQKEKYDSELIELGLLDKPLPHKYKLICARLLGASITDGSITIRKNGYYDAAFYVGEEPDVFELTDDIIKLGFGYSSMRHRTRPFKDTTHTTWEVAKNGCFAYFMTLIGAFAGKKTEQIRKLPIWLLESGKDVKREFLSAFQGGDGGKITMQQNCTTHKLCVSPTCQTTTNEYLEETKAYMESVSAMFAEFDINTNVSAKISTYSDNKYNVFLNFENSLENIHGYADQIYYKYCNEKRRKSAIAIEYIKCKHHSVSTKLKMQADAISLYDKNKKICNIAKDVNGSPKYIQKIIAAYKKGKSLNPKADIIGFNEFKKLYKEKEDKILAPIESIRKLSDDEFEPVYDFETVSPNHSFIASNIICHNCPVETPEGAKVGLVKSLAMMGNVTIALNSQIYIIKKTLEDMIINLEDVHPYDFNKYVKVFLNGEWLGMTHTPNEIVLKLRTMRRNNELEKTVSVVFDTSGKEIKLYCDAGRLFRPLLRVENNEILLKQSMIDEITLESNNKSKISKWTDFLQKHPDVIEYVDVEESDGLMISMYSKDVYKMKTLMDQPFGKNLEDTKINRYDNSIYVRYTHCEIHPSLMLGVVASSIPYCNHNQSPRNIYQYSQARQAMGIYNSSYRHRLDISYVLHNPQTPLITTRSSKYLHTDKLAAGENAIVAICTYSGYNQEDSIIFNQSAIDRGLFSAISFKKYQETIAKNPSTSQDDVFTKPDINKVIGTKTGSYDKLNDKGYIPEETKVVNGDIIIGKISPIQPTGDNNKIFKDSSITYKSNVQGVVDKVWTNIYNYEGYEMYKMRIRALRKPKIGDKMSSRHGQKGTIGITYKQEDMPFTEDGITPDIIINPNCLTGDAVVMLDNREVTTIKNIVENKGKYSVKSLDPKTFEIINTKIINEFVRQPDKKMYKIKTWSGREIKCTADHQFLLFNGKWKNAEDLQPHVDKITINHMVNILPDDNGELPKSITLHDAKIMARMCGVVKNTNHNNIALETYEFKKDIALLKYIPHEGYLISNKWISKAPSSVIREYLSGFYSSRTVITDDNIRKLLKKLEIEKEYDDNFYDVIDIRYDRELRKQKIVEIEYNKCLSNGHDMTFDRFKNTFPRINESIAMFVESIEEIEKEPVYDFTTMAETHSFLANGFVVHNCMPSRSSARMRQQCLVSRS